jgi:CcmD family protein
VSYLLAAYSVVLVTVLVYLAIHALKIARLEREVSELEHRREGSGDGR